MRFFISYSQVPAMATVNDVSRSAKQKRKIRSILRNVDEACSVIDLLPILQSLPLSVVKQFVNQQMQQATSKRISSIYHDVISIDDILPSDVMQHILSFDGFYHPKAVNKQWKELCDMNEKNEMSRLYSSIPLSVIQSSSTYVIHPKRKHLTALEIERGYKGPMNIEYAFECGFSDGDTLLFHDGTHYVKNSKYFDMIQVSI